MGSVSLGMRCLLVISVILIFIELADSARGGGGRYGGSRYSSSRYRSNRYRSTRYRIRNSGSSRIRVRYGSSARYHGIYMSGYYGYGYDSGHYDDFTICQNYVTKDKNGTSMGKFFCPMYGDPSAFTYCCGPEDEEHCCDFFADPGRGWGLLVGIVGGCILIGLVAFCIITCFCGGCDCKGSGGGSFSYSYDSD